MAFAMYSSLTTGAAEVIERFGTDAQKARFLDKMFRGRWTGTMCLTESHAGSDLGMCTTKAVPQPDGSYRITGTKTFISGGDHDLTDNIVHLVLTRVEGGGPGTLGLSLFIVPKYRVGGGGQIGEHNDVTPISVEHKMGISGSATCMLAFGESDNCTGELLGTSDSLHQGLKQIFMLMNKARLGVGLQGLAVASPAYLRALQYTRERKQGSSVTSLKDPSAPRVSIIEHPDVRRMLIDMKARVEGLRALHIKTRYHCDYAAVFRNVDDKKYNYHRGQVEVLTPIFKSYATDQGFRVCESAIQTMGGAGYISEYGLEQYCRDVKVCSL